MADLLSLPHPRHSSHLLPTKGIHPRVARARQLNGIGFTAAAGKMSVSSHSHPSPETRSLSHLAPLEAILFDIDGTLCDSDPIHYCAFRETLQEIGFNDGVPITEDFYVNKISGNHNDDIARSLFPGWDHDAAMKILDDKEAMYRRMAPEKLQAVDGLHKLCRWIEGRGIKRAAVTNAPRANAQLMISLLGLTDFFQLLVVGSECDRPKPHPDPYLKALKDLDASPNHTFVFEDSASGIEAAVAAAMPVLGLATRNPEQLLMDAGATFLIKNFEDPKLWESLGKLV
ncbi:haloacid dehalogenase-like hydrolase [Musa troglodytarum]|uniref:Haloacid dehalogenase-like hydrolase n=1 Tax=Musa troglodytarum TaxID=320322 RepID=A0A9E7JWU8_9LILI|nr:haloacid dehalogenase-like hydrolase [Musa troglodytarum]